MSDGVAKPDSEQLKRVLSTLTSTHHHFIYRDTNTAPHELIQALCQALPHIPVGSWKERISNGGTYVNGHPALVDGPLPATPFRIEYYEPRPGAHEQLYRTLDPSWIVHEDKEIIAINKPPGLTCNQAREQHSSHLRKLVEDYLGRQAHLPSRLDTSARGLVVISTSGKMHKILQQAYERHQVEKYYLLAVSPVVPWKGKLVENQLDADPRHPVLRRVVESGGDLASTFFSRIAEITLHGQQCSVILAKPRTGRTHQLRVQMAHLGHPIVGDNFYGGLESSELHLLSIKVKFYDSRPNVKLHREFKLRPQDLPAWAKPEWIV